MSTFLFGFGAAFLFSGGAAAVGGLLYCLCSGIGSALRRRRHRDSPTLLDVSRRYEPATKQDMAKARDAWQALLDDIRRERLRIERGDP